MYRTRIRDTFYNFHKNKKIPRKIIFFCYENDLFLHFYFSEMAKFQRFQNHGNAVYLNVPTRCREMQQRALIIDESMEKAWKSRHEENVTHKT